MRILKKEIWPSKILITKDEFDGDHYEIEMWLGEKMGSFKGRWNTVPSYQGVHYYFRDSKDATLFALKWS
jgi:hypothetical protein